MVTFKRLLSSTWRQWYKPTLAGTAPQQLLHNTLEAWSPTQATSSLTACAYRLGSGWEVLLGQAAESQLCRASSIRTKTRAFVPLPENQLSQDWRDGGRFRRGRGLTVHGCRGRGRTGEWAARQPPPSGGLPDERGVFMGTRRTLGLLAWALVLSVSLSIGSTSPLLAQGAQAQGQDPGNPTCFHCVGAYDCEAISHGTGGVYCYVNVSGCHESLDICVIAAAPESVSERVLLADGRSVEAVPLSPYSWVATTCSSGALILVGNSASRLAVVYYLDAGPRPSSAS
jgi:hypothetical protein